MVKVHAPLFRSFAYGTRQLTECFTTTASLLITQCVCSEARAISVLWKQHSEISYRYWNVH